MTILQYPDSLADPRGWGDYRLTLRCFTPCAGMEGNFPENINMLQKVGLQEIFILSYLTISGYIKALHTAPPARS